MVRADCGLYIRSIAIYMYTVIVSKKSVFDGNDEIVVNAIDSHQEK